MLRINVYQILTIDKLGRKPLLYIGSIIGFLMMGFTLYFSEYSTINSAGLPCLVEILIFIASFAMSMGSVVWVILSEISPNKVRGMAMSIAVGSAWISNYIVSQTFSLLVENDTNKLKIEGGYWNNSLPFFPFPFSSF
ncbi:MAG: MFS transporter [Cellulophaga sp.]